MRPALQTASIHPRARTKSTHIQSSITPSSLSLSPLVPCRGIVLLLCAQPVCKLNHCMITILALGFDSLFADFVGSSCNLDLISLKNLLDQYSRMSSCCDKAKLPFCSDSCSSENKLAHVGKVFSRPRKHLHAYVADKLVGSSCTFDLFNSLRPHE